MSKRIMNRVMCLAEDNGIDIFYQDTDSMHLPMEDVEKLAKLYKEKYRSDLIGKGMGQFETDFAMGQINKQDENSTDNWDKKAEVYAVESFFLGKKFYLDVLESKNKRNETIIDHHIRAKGIPNDAILYYVEMESKDHKSSIHTVKDLYQGLLNGETHKFDLTCGGKKCGFVYDKNPCIVTNYKYGKKDGQLTRRICF